MSSGHDRPQFVLQPWLADISFMQQSVLISACRGPDGLHKNHIAKVLLRWMRRCFLYSALDRRILYTPYEQGGGSFTGPCNVGGLFSWPPGPRETTAIDEAVAQYHRTLDEVPHHFQTHFLHAAEILGYKHPDHAIRQWWNGVYCGLVKDMHLAPETESAMDYRLGDDEKQWREGEVVTAD
jgi:hypothetical protein